MTTKAFGWELLGLLGMALAASAQSSDTLSGTKPLALQGDLSAQMVSGIDKFLLREIDQSTSLRSNFWQRNFASVEAYGKSVQPNRERLAKLIGCVDARKQVTSLEFVSDTSTSSHIAGTNSMVVHAVRWPVFEGVFGEGLWLVPKIPPIARVIVVPDADQTPEMLVGLAPGIQPDRQFARRLGEMGCEVLVPVLVDRLDTWSGNERLKRFTNQPHREWIYRQAFMLGRHIIGYEVQKVLAAADFFESENSTGKKAPIGVAGFAEGGLICFYAAALDPRISSCLVSGYFGSRQRLWEEPIYRNVFGLLNEFGDAEIASLIAPRTLVIEHSPIPTIAGPPKPREGRSGAAPGKLKTVDYELVEAELERARELLGSSGQMTNTQLRLISGAEGMTTGPGSDRALVALLNGLGMAGEAIKRSGIALTDSRQHFDPTNRARRQFEELQNYTQKLFRQSESVRADFFWSKLKSSSTQDWATSPFRKIFAEEVIGNFSSPALPPNPQSRRLTLPRPAAGGERSWTGYEVVLDVYPDVFAWGYLLVPADIKPGERRPVVVCQHGLDGVPADVLNEDSASQGFRFYKAFAARLADEGFVVFAPHNPYRGGDRFRQLQRKANTIGKSLFSVITAQHERILDWLAQQPFVDPSRIGFYGLSYGGKTAMRVPSQLNRYALSICSGDFNEWVEKNLSVDFPGSYMFTGEYEMPEWNLGHTFNYAEMAGLIAPRPFMVERGHDDQVGIDEWVAYEYAKVRRLYAKLGIPERTTIEYFNGPHTINGVGTFEFLRRHLNWPRRTP